MAQRDFQYVDIKWIAARLSVSVSVVRRLKEYESLKAARVTIGRKWRWVQPDAEKWVRGFYLRKQQGEAAERRAQNEKQQRSQQRQLKREARKRSLCAQPVVNLAEYHQVREEPPAKSA